MEGYEALRHSRFGGLFRHQDYQRATAALSRARARLRELGFDYEPAIGDLSEPRGLTRVGTGAPVSFSDVIDLLMEFERTDSARERWTSENVDGCRSFGSNRTRERNPGNLANLGVDDQRLSRVPGFPAGRR